MRRGARDWLVFTLIGLGCFILLALASQGPGGIAWNYLASVLFTMCVFALFALGLNLQFGYTGLLNFGHVASMAIGGYSVALVDEWLHERGATAALTGTAPLALLAALFLAVLVGILVWVPLLLVAARLRHRRQATWIALGLAALAGLIVLGAVVPLSASAARDVVTLVSIVAGVVLAAAWGALIALPTVRLRDDYLAIVTIAAAEILRSILQNEEDITHGTLGIQSLNRPLVDAARASPAWQALAERLGVLPTLLAHLVAALLLLGLAVTILQALGNSPWGRVLKAIREDPEVPRSLGKSVQHYKLQVLMIGSGIGSLAGVLFVWNLSNVYPEHFLSILTFYAFMIVIIGGTGNNVGVLAGTAILWTVFELAGNANVASPLLGGLGLSSFAGPPQAILIGLLIIGFMMFRPEGALGRREEMFHAK